MLIINIVSNENEKYKGRFFKKQIRPDAFKRSCMRICGKICTLMEFNENMLGTLNLDRLFITFKGQILGAEWVLEKLVPCEYRFDNRPYFKRALLSSLINNLGKSANNYSVCVIDDDFCCSDEYYNLANAVKSFTLISRENNETDKFTNHCFVEYGNYIKISDKYVSGDIILDFNMLDDSKIIITKEGKEQLLYPDPRYFSVKDDLLPLINMGIDAKILCGAFCIVP